MRVLFVASECAPFVKTGGLADVVSALPKALGEIGIETRVLLPGYPPVLAALGRGAKRHAIGTRGGEQFDIVAGRADGLDLLALDAPALFDRPGNPYLGPDRADWPDNHLRFGALCRAAAALATDEATHWRQDVVHGHDWQAGLVPAYLRLAGRTGPPTVTTIHNIAFQGLVPVDQLDVLRLPAGAFTIDGLEFHGRIGFLKAGLVYADRITTVSPTYARELATPEFGMGLDGVVAARRADLTGILNGADLEAWNPETDTRIAATYSARSLARKALNRATLAARFKIEEPDAAPLVCVVSRLTDQKGLDLVLEALPRIAARGAKLVLLGSGDTALEAAYRDAAAASEGGVGVVIGYDEPLSHLMIAGADAILVPSRFEPCGLTQLYGLRYGTVPVVARTGGLEDSVIDANEAALAAGCATGFQFARNSLDGLCDAIDRVCDLFADQRRWAALVRRAMRHPVGWQDSAKAYADLYASLLTESV
jgi:starch synthase